jgi:hypothetical protein
MASNDSETIDGKYDSDEEEVGDNDDDINEGVDDYDYGDNEGSNEGSQETVQSLFGDCSVSSDEGISEEMRGRFGAGGASTNICSTKNPVGQSISSEDKINIEDFMDDLEERILPLSHIVSRKEQYQYAVTACESHFNLVSNMDKVSNSILRLIADAAAIALRDRTANEPEVNLSFMKYAEQRFV